jgi:8-oxo-dGTP pyrophosphatase MutT (NUDIX family)
MLSQIVAKSILVNPEDKILVLRRSLTDSHSAGRVDFPGGSVEEFERYAAGAAREVHEEAGLTVPETDLHLAFSYTNPINHEGLVITRLLYIARIALGEVQLSHEHDRFWWHDMDAVIEEFAGTGWASGIQFIQDNQLLDRI